MNMRLFSCGLLNHETAPLEVPPAIRSLGTVLFGSLLAAGILGQAHSVNATTVPSIAAGAYGSTNWGGYADVVPSDSANTFTAVSGQWTVPTIQEPAGASSAYSAFWVGLDGFNSNTVEQTGIEAQISGSTTTYYAWYEMYPQAETPVFTVAPGDVITASVNYNTNTDDFTLAISAKTSRGASAGSYSISVAGSGMARTSAEWIAEAPTIQYYNGTQKLSTLANFGSETFSNASATLAGTTGSISGLPPLATVDSIEMLKQTSTGSYVPLAIPSGLTDSGSTLTVTYVPEPASLAVLALGMAAIPLLRRRKTSRA
ncbi:MAG: G1 family glutamic endopeptidase [Phycisphaerae bacterium]